MLIEFTFGNFKSFYEAKQISMVASSLKEHLDSNTFEVLPAESVRAKPIRLLRSAAIYGANASGKSNLIQAISFMKRFIIQGHKRMLPGESIPITCFLLDKECEKKESIFEVIFISDGIRYRYGFEITRQKVKAEWLYYAPKGKEAKLFVRDEKKFSIGRKFKEGRGLEEKTRENVLFISVCMQFNGKHSQRVYEWFRNKLRIIYGLNDESYMKFTFKQLGNEKARKRIETFLREADLGIAEINYEEIDAEAKEIPDEIKKKIEQLLKDFKKKAAEDAKIESIVSRVTFRHTKANDPNFKNVEFPLDFESEGTKKIFSMSGLILECLKEGNTLLIDELDSRIHPFITRFVVQLFNSNRTNFNNAQLIFATHDTNVLDRRIFRKDQIWFTEKDLNGSSDIYSLSDYKIPSKANFQKDYILGKYGAIPFLGDPNKLSLGEVNDD